MSAATYVVFRYDDLAADAPSVRETDKQRQAVWDAERAMDELFASRGFPYVVGIIPNATAPFYIDTAKVSMVTQALNAGRLQVALHGFTHTNHASANARASEFNRDFSQQLADINAGLSLLRESVHLDRITTFIPPFNDWNESTARALVSAGFQILSADRYRHSSTVDSLTVVPFTAQLWDLETLVNNRSLPTNSVVVVILHPPQIADIQSYDGRFFGLPRLKSLLAKIGTMQDIHVVTFDQLVKENSELSAARYAAAARLWQWRTLWEKLLPESYRPGAKNVFLYESEAAYSKLNLSWLAITSTVILCIIALSTFVTRIILTKRSVIFIRIVFVAAAFAVLSAALLVWDLNHRGFNVNGVRLFPLCAAIGFFLASLSRLFGSAFDGRPSGEKSQ